MHVAYLVALLVLSTTLPAAADPPLSAAAVRARMEAAVRALQRDKASWTPAQRKVSSKLLYACRMRRGEAIAEGVPRLRKHVDWAADGTTLVDLRADVSDALLGAIEALGGEVVNAHPDLDAVRARLPEPAVDALSQRGDVHSLRPAGRHYLRKVNTSEGDFALRVAFTRAVLGADGTGLSVGVLSDGVDTLAARQATGDLPMGVTVLTGAAGSGDEGTAMLEIVHDLAPGAALLFATAIGGEATMATNIQALEAAGADVIVDDIGYFEESVFQDSDISAAVDAVTAAGSLYFSAAGNDGNEDDGTSGVWEGDWLDSGMTYSGSPLHEFSHGFVDNIIQADTPNVFTLKWSDPLGTASNDYDLYLFDPMGMPLDSSVDAQDGIGGNDFPLESIGSIGFDDTGNRLSIVKFAGVARTLSLNSYGGELEATTASQIYGHPGARGAVAVAATDWILAGGTSGEFNGSESVETFSSDGPRRVHYEASGTPITPGNFSSTGGELRSKPDLTAADCVSTATPGFGVFCGTSAAAPHAAAIAAVLWEAGGGGTTAADVRAAMESGTIDIEAPGDDRDSGHGIVDALLSASVLLPEPSSALMLGAGALLVTRLARRRGTL